MPKLHLTIRSLVACTATILMAGSASASSSSDLEDFFDSLFGNDNNGRHGLHIGGHDTPIGEVSVLPDPTGTPPTHGDTDEDTNVAGNDPGLIIGGGEMPRPVPVETGTHPVPEPSAAMLFGLGALVIARRVRR